MVYADIKNNLIRVKFKYHPLYVQEIKTIPSAKYIKETKTWIIPLKDIELFKKKFDNFMVIWNGVTGQDIQGIDEKAIPEYPIAPGYSVIYDDEHNIVDSTGFKVKPWGEYQVKGFNMIYDRDFLILADEAGLGKTYQTITALEAKKKAGMLKYGIIICKASLLYTWKEEIEKYTNETAIVIAGDINTRSKIYDELYWGRTSPTFMIISYETFRADLSNILFITKGKHPLDCCVLDEAQKVKNPTSRIGQAIFQIPFKYKYVLTATPLPNSPLEAYNYLKWGGIIHENWYAFQKTYALFGGYGNHQIIGYKNVKQLSYLLRNNMLRRRKEDKLKELPEITFKRIYVDMTKEQRKIYDAIKNEIAEDLAETFLDKVPAMLSKLVRLQQVTDYPPIIGSKAESAKLKALDDLIDDLTEGGEKVIVFSRFKTVVEMLEERYKKYNPAVIHGDIDARGLPKTSALKKLIEEVPNYDSLPIAEKDRLLDDKMISERQRRIRKFQNDDDCKIFIGCAPACREGLTLTKATHVIFYDYEWSYDYIYQAYSRAYRIGQRNAVTVYYLLCKDSIDEHVLDVVETKKNIIEAVYGTTQNIKSMKAKDFIKKLA